ALSIALLAITLPFFVDVRYHGSGDTRPAELLPVVILRDHSLTYEGLGPDIANWSSVRMGENVVPESWGFTPVNGHLVSGYPIVPGLVNLPVYLVAALAQVDVQAASPVLSAITAALVAATSTVLMFLLLKRLFESVSTALIGAAIYAFCTCVWS